MHSTTNDNQKKTVDPILTLQISQDELIDTPTESAAVSSRSIEAVTSLCFVNSPKLTFASDGGNSDSDDDVPTFECGNLLKSEKKCDSDATATARSVAATLGLAGRLLGTCQYNGDSFVWDLGQRKILQRIMTRHRGPGLVLRRIDDTGSDSRFLYHTRDELGTVSLHDLQASCSSNSSQVVTEFETHSRTFCSAAPCRGNSNLVVMPFEDRSFAVVRDWRISKQDSPVAVFHGFGGVGSYLNDVPENSRKYGMLMSVAMVENNGTTTIACGMENGDVCFHDLAMLKNPNAAVEPCSLSLGVDPVLSVDLSSSIHKNSEHRSVVAIAGMARGAETVVEGDRGRVAVIKATMETGGNFSARIRSRLASSDPRVNLDNGYEEPGVAICRFRPDGRLFAIGGSDKRLRIFDRSTPSHLLAILRGHTESVDAIDWSNDAEHSGLLATGSADGRVNVWRCFASESE